MPLPSGTKYRVKTIIKDGCKKKIRLAFDPKGDVIEHKKIHYTKVPAEQIHKLFDPEYLHMEKIDGAAALYKLLSDRIEILSYRPTTAGRRWCGKSC